MIGWLIMPILSTMEGVINPRAIFLQCHEEGKAGIVHWVDDYRISKCGIAKFMTSVYDYNHQNTAVQNLDESNWRDKFVICPECEKEWKRDKNDIS